MFIYSYKQLLVHICGLGSGRIRTFINASVIYREFHIVTFSSLVYTEGMIVNLSIRNITYTRYE